MNAKNNLVKACEKRGSLTEKNDKETVANNQTMSAKYSDRRYEERILSEFNAHRSYKNKRSRIKH